MKHIFTYFTVLISASLFSQIEQNINKSSGTVSNPIQEIDSIRFNGSLTEMELILNNGNIETHLINDIQNITFSGNLLGEIAGLNCNEDTNAGTLIQGQEASGVSSTVSYTGGNGGTYSGQTVNSTGVTGLTATLEAGIFANGNGTLLFTITGTPASSGAASFAISIGGLNCTLIRNVILPEGLIASINCGTVTNQGTLIQGQQASGVSSTVSYTGGNGGTYSAQTVNSTGVTGLTATLEAGVFANGNGTLLFTITETPASSGDASFAINIGG